MLILIHTKLNIKHVCVRLFNSPIRVVYLYLWCIHSIKGKPSTRCSFNVIKVYCNSHRRSRFNPSILLVNSYKSKDRSNVSTEESTTEGSLVKSCCCWCCHYFVPYSLHCIVVLTITHYPSTHRCYTFAHQHHLS